MPRESTFQRKLKAEIKERFPGCYILKNDPNCIQGIPDLLVLYKDKWAMLEVKKDANEHIKKPRPNQDVHVERLNNMSFASFIFPENKEDVLSAMARSFEV